MSADERGSETGSGREDTGEGSGRRHPSVPSFAPTLKGRKELIEKGKPVGKKIPVLFRKLRTLL